MPKAEPHFDVAALLAEVFKQDFGLVVSTNDTTGFRRIVYKHMRQHPEVRIHIYADPRARNSFFLLRSAAANATLDEELPDGE